MSCLTQTSSLGPSLNHIINDTLNTPKPCEIGNFDATEYMESILSMESFEWVTDPIRQRMCSYCGSKRSAIVHYLARHAALLTKLKNGSQTSKVSQQNKKTEIRRWNCGRRGEHSSNIYWNTLSSINFPAIIHHLRSQYPPIATPRWNQYNKHLNKARFRIRPQWYLSMKGPFSAFVWKTITYHAVPWHHTAAPGEAYQQGKS